MNPFSVRAFELDCSAERAVGVAREALQAAGLRILHLDKSGNVIVADRPGSYWRAGNTVLAAFQQQGDRTKVTVRSESQGYQLMDLGGNGRLINAIEAQLRRLVA